MGRPVRRDVRGTDVFGTYESAAGIRCEAYFASNQTDVYIIKQKGAHRYLVADSSAIQDEDIVVGNTYVIVDTNNTNWAALGVDNAYNGKVFKATNHNRWHSKILNNETCYKHNSHCMCDSHLYIILL